MLSLKQQLALDELIAIEIMVGPLGPKSREHLDRFADKHPDLIEAARLESVVTIFED